MHLLNICVFVEPDSACERKKTTKWCRNAGQRERAAGLGDGTLVRMSGFVTKKEQLQVTSEKKSAQSASSFNFGFGWTV